MKKKRILKVQMAKKTKTFRFFVKTMHELDSVDQKYKWEKNGKKRSYWNVLPYLHKQKDKKYA